jgi:hypothetical protein
MNSKTRTRILYEDPNSIFKANKRVFLHELQGSTLRTKRPLPDEIDAQLKTADVLSKLILKMSNLNDILDYFTGSWQGIISSSGILRNGIIIINGIASIIKQILKLPRTSFNEDDGITIKNILDDLVEKYQQTIVLLQNAPLGPNQQPIEYPVALRNILATFLNSLSKLFQEFKKVIPYIDITGKVQSLDIVPMEIQPVDAVDAVDEEDFQDAVEGPMDGLEGAGRRRLLRGSGRYKVLSDRAHVIQSQPYKRFL